MHSVSTRTRITLGLACLPALALLAWWAALQFPLSQLPPPRWELTSEVSIVQDHLGGAELGNPPPEVVNTPPPGTLAPSEVAWRAQRWAAEYSMFGNGPTLVRATFPDGIRRLAWRRVVLTSSSGMEGKATALYLDPQTGAPLALIRNIPVIEPSFSVLSIDPYFLDVQIRQSAPPTLLVMYLAVVSVVALVRYWRQAR